MKDGEPRITLEQLLEIQDPNEIVRQVWQDYDVEEESHEENARSNENGFVSFPERTLRTSPEERAKGRAKNIRELGVHASFGVHAYILCWTNDLEGDVNYEVGKPLPTQLVMRRRALPKGGI